MNRIGHTTIRMRRQEMGVVRWRDRVGRAMAHSLERIDDWTRNIVPGKRSACSRKRGGSCVPGHRARAFTLIELLLVLLIMAVMTGMVVVAYNNISQARTIVYTAQQIAAACEYAQNLAVVRGCTVRVVFMDPVTTWFPYYRFCVLYEDPYFNPQRFDAQTTWLRPPGYPADRRLNSQIRVLFEEPSISRDHPQVINGTGGANLTYVTKAGTTKNNVWTLIPGISWGQVLSGKVFEYNKLGEPVITATASVYGVTAATGQTNSSNWAKVVVTKGVKGVRVLRP